MPRGKFKYRYCFFADTPNVTWTVSVIWKDLSWRPDFCCHLKQRGGCTIPMFQLSLRCEKYAAARHNTVIGNQLLFANNRNRFRWLVLCLSQDGACTDSFENFRENSLKGDLSNDILSTPLFSHWSTPLNAAKSKFIVVNSRNSFHPSQAAGIIPWLKGTVPQDLAIPVEKVTVIINSSRLSK